MTGVLAEVWGLYTASLPLLSSIIAGRLLAPCYALVATLLYYRVSEAHADAMPAAPQAWDRRPAVGPAQDELTLP